MKKKESEIKKYGDMIKQISSVILKKEDEDFTTINEWKDENPFAEDVLKKLTNEDTIKNAIKEIKSYEKKKEEYTRKFKDSIKPKKKNIFYKIIISAAAAIIAVSFIVYNENNKYVDEPNIVILNKKTEEISNEPVIIFSSGEKASLLPSDRLINDKISTADIDKLRSISNVDKLLTLTNISEGKYKDENRVKLNKIITPKERTITITLSDGTEVTLNANSTFEFPSEFNSSAREVTLYGEAYLKVAKNSSPFIVNTSSAAVKVYGTEFNVINRDDQGLDLVLIKGSVSVKAEKIDEIMIKPSERVLYDKKIGKILVETIDTNEYTAWLNNLFMFKEKKLSEIINKISIWYGVEFEVRKELSDELYTLVLDKGTSIDDMIDHISSIIDAEIVYKERRVF